MGVNILRWSLFARLGCFVDCVLGSSSAILVSSFESRHSWACFELENISKRRPSLLLLSPLQWRRIAFAPGRGDCKRQDLNESLLPRLKVILPWSCLSTERQFATSNLPLPIAYGNCRRLMLPWRTQLIVGCDDNKSFSECLWWFL